MEKRILTEEELKILNSKKGLMAVLTKEPYNLDRAIRYAKYQEKLEQLQIELIKMQTWAIENNERIIILFEGRDAAGKGGAIRRITERINPRHMRIVALPKPTEEQNTQWYFQRYVEQFPVAGEIVFFDRSWYNRAVVEPVMGFCTDIQYKKFLQQVPEFEHMLYEDGIVVIKFWLSISKEEQLKRFEARKDNPLKRWKFSPVDKKGQELWDKYTYYKAEMFTNTHTTYCPWTIIKTNNKKTARLEAMRYVLSKFDYDGKSTAETNLNPDPNIVMRYYRSVIQND